MEWVLLVVVGAVAAFVVNTVMAARRLKHANAVRDAAAPAAGPAAPPPPPAPRAIPPTWGWAKVHLKTAGLEALGYYYRDRSAGPSFKVLVDLLDGPSDDAIRRAAAATKYIANSTFRLGAHETLFAAARDIPAMAAMTEEAYAKGAGASGPGCAVVMMLTDAEMRAYELPAAMPGIEIYAS